MKKTFALAMPVLTIVALAPLHAFGYGFGTQQARDGRGVEQAGRVGSSVPAGLKTTLDKIVESYRKIIFLLDDEASLGQEERNRCVEVGRKIHQDKQELLDELTESLTADLRRAAGTRFREKPASVDGFIDYFNKNAGLRDVDRLAFLDMADEMLAVVIEAERAGGLGKSSTHTGDQLADPNKVNKDDRVFVFFAGHGATRRLPSGKELGYIVPVDAEAKASQAKSISMTQLQEFCELIPAKHLYFVVDSCYSGLALTRSGGKSSKSANYLEEITKRMARQILTAGGADQQVADNGPGGHSIFTWTLLQGLQGLADTDGNGAITASELGAYISPIVSSVSHQTPAFGNLAGSEGGEFVFELQQESLGEASKQLDEEAINLNNELERIQKEVASKRERNLKLRAKVEEERAKLEGTTANRGNQPPKSKAAQAQEHHNLGLKYYREKKYDEAVKELEQAVKLDPRNATIVNNLGFTLYRFEKYEESLVWLRKAIEIDPQRAVAYANLAEAYMKLGKTTEARQYYEKYAELAPNSPTIEYVRRKIEELKGR